MRFKVHLLKNHKPDTGEAAFTLSAILEEIKLKYQIHRWGLSHAFAGEAIAKVRLNGKAFCNAKKMGYEYELNLFGNDCGTMLDLFLGRMKKQFAMTGIGILSFAALLGIGADKAEAVVQPTVPSATSMEKTKVSSHAVSHAGFEAYLNEAFLEEYSSDKYKLVYYHSNLSSHVNTGDTHVNNPHSNNTHTNSWTNATSHQNQWNNTPHQNTSGAHTNVGPVTGHSNIPAVPGGAHTNVIPGTHSNNPGGTHSNTHSNSIPGDYIY